MVRFFAVGAPAGAPPSRKEMIATLREVARATSLEWARKGCPPGSPEEEDLTILLGAIKLLEGTPQG